VNGSVLFLSNYQPVTDNSLSYNDQIVTVAKTKYPLFRTLFLLRSNTLR
jgi:hypothetical protein